MNSEEAISPAASALSSLSRVVASSSCVITHPIGEAWALVREWGSCPWLSELDGRPHRATLLDGNCNTAVGARRVVHIGNQRMFEKLVAVDDEDHFVKWRLISHPDTVNPFLASLLNHKSKIKLTPIALGNHTLIEWQGSFFTEPQHASSMRITFAKLYVEGFRSLQKLLSGNASARSQNGSEMGLSNGRVPGERRTSLGSASGSLGSSWANSHNSSSIQSNSLGSLNGDRETPTIAPLSKYAQAYPQQGQPLSSMRNFKGTSLETIPLDRQLPMEDLAKRSNSTPEASKAAAEEPKAVEHERSCASQSSSRRGSQEEARGPDPPTSHGLGSSEGSFTFNDQLLAPPSSIGPVLNGFGKALSLSSAGSGDSAAGGPSSPAHQGRGPSNELWAALRSKQRWLNENFPTGNLRSGSDGKRFTDDACELARASLSAQEMQRINDAFQRSCNLGINSYPPDQPYSARNDSQASRLSKGLGVRSADLPPLKRAWLTGEPALDLGSGMLTPQVYESRGSSSSNANSEKSLSNLNRSGSDRVSLDHWVDK